MLNYQWIHSYQIAFYVFFFSKGPSIPASFSTCHNRLPNGFQLLPTWWIPSPCPCWVPKIKSASPRTAQKKKRTIPRLRMISRSKFLRKPPASSVYCICIYIYIHIYMNIFLYMYCTMVYPYCSLFSRNDATITFRSQQLRQMGPILGCLFLAEGRGFQEIWLGWNWRFKQPTIPYNWDTADLWAAKLLDISSSTVGWQIYIYVYIYISN